MIPGIVKYESVNFPNFPRMEDSFGLVQSDSMDLQNDPRFFQSNVLDKRPRHRATFEISLGSQFLIWPNFTNLCNLQNLQNLLIFDTISQFTTCQTFVEIVRHTFSFQIHFEFVWVCDFESLRIWDRSLRLRLWRAETCWDVQGLRPSLPSQWSLPWWCRGVAVAVNVEMITKWNRKILDIGKWKWHLWFWRWNDFKWDILIHFVHVRKLALRDAAN